MRQFLTVALLVCLPVLSWAQESNSQLNELKHRADSLYENYSEKEALEVYRQVLQLNPDDFQSLWRTSFLYARIGNRLNSKDKQREYFKESRLYAEQALQVDSTTAESNYVMAVAMGRMALIAGARERVAASREIRKYALKAIEIDPDHAGAHHVMGRWHYKIANLNFAERMAADYLFGGIPGEASNQKAIDQLRQAIKLEPDNIMYHYDLARVLVDEDQYDDARKELNQALSIETKNPDGPIYKKKARDLMDEIS